MKITLITLKNNFENLLLKEKPKVTTQLLDSLEHLYEHLNDCICDDGTVCKECQETREELRKIINNLDQNLETNEGLEDLNKFLKSTIKQIEEVIKKI